MIAFNRTFLVPLLGAVMVCVPAAQATTVWTNWTAATNGAPGTATGTVGSVGVTYTGQLNDFRIANNSGVWSPNSSFIGGSVDVSPSSVNEDLRTIGTFTGTNSIVFSTPVLNPVFAIWSLGQPGLQAAFNFFQTPSIQAGGPNSQFGGASITILGNTINGNEGNGVVQFNGTFSTISWTTTPENFYAFTVGLNEGVPEPATWALLGMGLAVIAVRSRKRT
jgi:PEP-CTERM motif